MDQWIVPEWIALVVAWLMVLLPIVVAFVIIGRASRARREQLERLEERVAELERSRAL